MEPITPQSSPEQPNRFVPKPSESESEAAEPAASTAPSKPKLTVGETLAKNWLVIAGLLTLMLFAGLYLWVRSVKQEVLAEQEPVAAASDNLEGQIPAVDAAPQLPATTPVEQLEQQRAEQQRAKYAQPTENPADVADVFAVDTAGTARRRKQRALVAAARRAEAARQAADVDTLETTLQDPTTGAYRSESVLVPQRRGSAGGGRGAALPARDVDGTPFETDPDVLAMLSTSPPETRLQYEKMTGKRYRDPTVAAQMIAQQSTSNGAATSGLVYDGFNTVKVGNASKMQLAPDVFYKCVINGPQKVRTGSVVIMRLIEDAVVSGVTFPKNTVFAGVASVNSNNVSFKIDRLGPTRVAADIYDFNYMPGIAIDPNKKVPRADGAGNELRNMATTEVSTAIDRSASAANSVTGVAGRVLTTLIGRVPGTTRLRDVVLPDGYPILITTAAAGQLGAKATGANR